MNSGRTGEADKKCDGVLVVEDEPSIRENLKALLEFEGYLVRTASNGEEGLGILRTSVHPCLILLDLMMPVMNGVEFLEVMERDNTISSIPVCIVSGALEQPKTKKACTFMKKPIDVDRLMQFVDRHCNDVTTSIREILAGKEHAVPGKRPWSLHCQENHRGPPGDNISAKRVRERKRFSRCSAPIRDGGLSGRQTFAGTLSANGFMMSR